MAAFLHDLNNDKRIKPTILTDSWATELCSCIAVHMRRKHLINISKLVLVWRDTRGLHMFTTLFDYWKVSSSCFVGRNTL